MLQPLLLFVEHRIVLLAISNQPLVYGEVHGVHRLAVILGRLTRKQISIITVEFTKVQSGGVWQQKPREYDPKEAARTGNVEDGGGRCVGKHLGRSNGAQLSCCGADTVEEGPDVGRKYLPRDNVGRGVWTKLSPKRTEEIEKL